MRNKVAVVVGHTKLRKGACSEYLPCEWDFNNVIADELAEEVDVYHYGSYNLGYTQMVKASARETDRYDYKLVLELHYNAASPAANGCEALYYFKNKNARAISEAFTAKYVRSIGGADRGAKALYSPKQRGFAAVYYRRPTTLILEPFFGTNYGDVERYLRVGPQGYADVIRDTIEFAETLLGPL